MLKVSSGARMISDFENYRSASVRSIVSAALRRNCNFGAITAQRVLCQGFIMDLSAANALVMVVSENFAQYPVETQRRLLEGIFQLADECQENLDDLADTPTNGDLRTNLVLAKLLISNALKNGALREGFLQAAQCFWPIAAPNFDSCSNIDPSRHDESLFPG